MIHAIFWLNLLAFVALIRFDQKYFGGDLENELDFSKIPLNIYGYISCASIYAYFLYCAHLLFF